MSTRSNFLPGIPHLMDPKHLLHQSMVRPTIGHEDGLQSRHPFVSEARKLLNEVSKLNILAAQWIDCQWDAKYSECQSELRLFVPRSSARPLGKVLPRPAWVRFNCLCTGVEKIPVIHVQMGTCPYIIL